MKKQLPIIKEQFSGRWLYKFVALIVAVSIWYTTLENKKDVLRSRMVRVSFIHKDKMQISSDSGDHVRLVVVGPKNLVYRFLQATPAIAIDLTDVAPGKKNLELKPTDFGLPNGVRLHRLEPNVMELNIKEVL